MSRQIHNKKILRGMTWEVIAKICVQLASWISTVIVARILVPEDYGLIATSGIFIGFLLMVSDMGLATGLINKTKVRDEEYLVVFWFSVTLNLLLFILIYFMAPFIADFYNEPLLTDIIRVSALMLIFSPLKLIPNVVLMREMDFKYSAFVQMGSQATVVVAVIVLATNGYGVWSLVYSVLLGQVFQVLAYIPRMKPVTGFDLSLSKVSDTIGFGSKVMVSKLLWYFNNQSATFLIGSSLGQKSLGYYDMANTLAVAPLSKIGAIFNRVAFPAISKVKGDKSHVAQIFITMHKYLLLVSIPIFTAVIIAAEEVVGFLFTEKWLPIVPILQAMAIMNIFKLSGMLIPSVLEGVGRPGEVLVYQIISAACTPLFIFIGLSWGLMGAVYAMLILSPCLYIYLQSRVLKNLEIKLYDFIQSVLPILLSAGAMALTLFLLKQQLTIPNSALELLVLISGSFTIYLSALFLFNRGLYKELKEGVALFRSEAI